MPMRSKVRWIIFFIVLPVAVYLYLTYGRAGFLKTGDLPPDFVLSDIDGNSFKLIELKDNVVIVHFWATWCSMCVHEFPSLVRLGEELKEDQVIILAINEDGGKWEPGTYRAAENGRFNILPDPEGSVADAYGVYSLPQTFVVGRDGAIVDVIAGMNDWDSVDTIERIRELARR